MALADHKSEACFAVQENEGSFTMGAYGYGGGDTLEPSPDGNTLTRTGTDHGQTYTVRYARVAGVPDWCQQQFDDCSAVSGEGEGEGEGE